MPYPTRRDYNEDIEGWVVSRAPTVRIEDFGLYTEHMPKTQSTGSEVLMMEMQIDSDREALNKKEYAHDKACSDNAPHTNLQPSYTPPRSQQNRC